MEDVSAIKSVLRHRAYERVKFIEWRNITPMPTRVWLAGGALLSEPPRDLDFFFPSDGNKKQPLPRFTEKSRAELIIETKNATTWKYRDRVIQFCAYSHPTLEALVSSFDYSHCQSGIELEIAHGALVYPVNDAQVFFTEAYITDRIIGTTHFTGSEYPLSSLMRLFKYHKRGVIPGNGYMIEVMRVLTAIVYRGFVDYEDFKDQLDAVDLNLVTNEVPSAIAQELFKVLQKK